MLDYEKKENVLLVRLNGRLDVYFAEEIEKEIIKLISDDITSHLVINLQKVDYLTSSGIGMFVTIMNKLKQSGKKLAICEINGTVSKILEVVEMTEFFQIFKNENEAFEFLTRQ